MKGVKALLEAPVCSRLLAAVQFIENEEVKRQQSL